uniref:Putative conserved secreted protein n=1 Tax=Amblyomma sculptum TaxID=1581419 RepID=A0A1E1XVE7_AMBSC
MTLTKLLYFALFAVTIMAMMGRCSAYGNDVIRQCPITPGPCYIHHNGMQEGCPWTCRCISNKYNQGIYNGWGRCFTNRRTG